MNNPKVPPEVSAQIDKIISAMVNKVEPEMKQIVLLLKQHGISGATVGLNMGSLPVEAFGFPLKIDPSMPPNAFRFEPPMPAPAVNPANDLVEGIYQILNLNYENLRTDICGIVFDKNHNTAFEIGKIMEAARKRDKESLARELDILIKKLCS